LPERLTSLPGVCVPALRAALRDCLDTELREHGTDAGWAFRAALEHIGWTGNRDIEVDLLAHRWAVETALRRRLRLERAASNGRARMLPGDVLLATLGLPALPDARRARTPTWRRIGRR
jgi:hypothetical protein